MASLEFPEQSWERIDFKDWTHLPDVEGVQDAISERQARYNRSFINKVRQVLGANPDAPVALSEISYDGAVSVKEIRLDIGDREFYLDGTQHLMTLLRFAKIRQYDPDSDMGFTLITRTEIIRMMGKFCRVLLLGRDGKVYAVEAMTTAPSTTHFVGISDMPPEHFSDVNVDFYMPINSTLAGSTWIYMNIDRTLSIEEIER